MEGNRFKIKGEARSDLPSANCVDIPLSGSLRDGFEAFAKSQLPGQEELLGRLAPGESMAGAAAAVVDGMMEFTQVAVSVLLYLASSEPDLARRPAGPRQKSRTVVLGPAAVWEVGWRIGQVLREPGTRVGGEARTAQGRGPTSGVRTGICIRWAKSEPSLRRRELRWVAPVVVAAGEEVVPTARRVSERSGALGPRGGMTGDA